MKDADFSLVFLRELRVFVVCNIFKLMCMRIKNRNQTWQVYRDITVTPHSWAVESALPAPYLAATTASVWDVYIDDR